MVGLAGALVINIGTLSPPWVEAMLLAGRAANGRGVPVVLDPVGAGATRYRTETAKRILDEVDVTVLRGNAGEVATLVGVEAEVRGVESIGVGGDLAELAHAAARDARRRRLGDRRRSTTSRTVIASSRSRTAIRCSPRSRAPAACRARLPAVSSRLRTSARARGRGARRVRRRGRGRPRREGTGQLPRRRCTTRSPLSIRRRSTAGQTDVRMHAIVADLDTAQRAVDGATVVQLRVKAPTAEVVARGQGFADLDATFVVNDDVDAAFSSARTACISASPTRRGPRPGCGPAARPLVVSSSRRSRGPRPTTSAPDRWPNAVEGRRRPADRTRRAGRDRRGRLGPGRRDRRDRRLERRRDCIRAGAAGVAVIRAATDPELRRGGR